MAKPIIRRTEPLYIAPDGEQMVNLSGLGFVRVADCEFRSKPKKKAKPKKKVKRKAE